MEENLKTLIQAIAERQKAADRQLSELSAAVKALEARMAELGKPSAESGAPAPAKAAPAAQASPAKAQVTPEVLVMLAAAAAAYLGKEVRIRSAQKIYSHSEALSPWAQQGRAFIQASHSQHFRR